LANTNLIDNSTVDVLTENLRRLLASVPHGDKQLIAAAAGVNPATLSTWEGGAHQPRPENRRRLLASLGVWPDADLDEEPLFLSPLPLTVYERRRWLKGRIDTLPPGLLADLFPALQRLLAS
jgi:transcriptional regulator with XRE-family HTH domain